MERPHIRLGDDGFRYVLAADGSQLGPYPGPTQALRALKPEQRKYDREHGPPNRMGIRRKPGHKTALQRSKDAIAEARPPKPKPKAKKKKASKKKASSKKKG